MSFSSRDSPSRHSAHVVQSTVNATNSESSGVIEDSNLPMKSTGSWTASVGENGIEDGTSNAAGSAPNRTQPANYPYSHHRSHSASSGSTPTGSGIHPVSRDPSMVELIDEDNDNRASFMLEQSTCLLSTLRHVAYHIAYHIDSGKVTRTSWGEDDSPPCKNVVVCHLNIKISELN